MAKIRFVSEKPKKQPPALTKEENNRGFLRRTFSMLIVCGILLFLPVVGMLFKLMIVDHDKYETQAINNQTRSTSVEASRGTIYDRNMNILAASTTVENVFIDPLEIAQSNQDVNLIATGLGTILDVDPARIKELAADTEMRYKMVARKQSKEATDRVRTFIEENGLKGIHLENDTKRYYPYSTLAAQVIGFTNAENRGAEGLEAYYQSTLEGTQGEVVRTKGNYETEMLYNYEKYYEASDGNSLVLTIDSTVQYYLEKNLEAAIEKYNVVNGAFAIMMNVNTGEILGMANMGQYDPNNYMEIYDTRTQEELAQLREKLIQEMQETLGVSVLSPDSEAYEMVEDAYDDAVAAARLSQWRNRCVSDGYEPGSTFKTLTLAAALEEGAVTLDDTFSCFGQEDFAGRDQTLHCWKAYGHGIETTAQALQNSCNLAFAHIGLRLGGEKMYDYAKAFGLLERTGIDMSGEGYSVFHTKTKLADPLTTAYLIDTSFGQSIKVTPIQMVRAIAAVVNGGYVLEPYVVSQVLDDSGNVVQKNSRTVLRQAISAETSATMCELLESVVSLGTAGNAKLSGYKIGGKTGTSEKLDVLDENGNIVNDKIVSFIGVAPMDDPQYVVLVALDTPKTRSYYISGGVMAAPVVRDIFADTLLYLGVQPDYTDVDMSTVNVEMPDVREMTEQEAAEALAAQSLVYRTVGDGAQEIGRAHV